jgi:hypothetical protein
MIAALRAAETKTERSGGADRKGGWGEMNARPALAFAAAEFRASEASAPQKMLFYQTFRLFIPPCNNRQNKS